MIRALIARQRDPRSWPIWPAAPCAARSTGWTRRSPGSSPTITPSCWPRCWPAGDRRSRPINADLVWHLLADPDTHFTDLGADLYDQQTSNSRKMRTHLAGLEA
jgi:hypothetical protein